MDDLLQQGITAYKAGKRDEARKIFIAVVKQSPDNERAWGWMYQASGNDKERTYCLQQMLRINPKNEKASQLLDQLLEPPLTSNSPSSSTPLSTQTPSPTPVPASLKQVSSSNIDNISSEPPIRFIPAKCPNCGGELRVPENREVVKCMYCGYDILIHDKNRLVIETKINTERILDLANAAKEVNNHEEAYKYYSQVLEQDSNSAEAWIGKGISAGWQSSVPSQRISEAIACIKRGVVIDPNEKETAAIGLIRITLAYTISLTKYFAEKWRQDSRVSGPLSTDPIMGGLIGAANSSYSQKEINKEFWQTHHNLIIQALTFSWQLSNSPVIAKNLYKTLDVIKQSNIFTTETQTAFEQQLDIVLNEINNKFPDLITKAKEDDQATKNFIIMCVVTVVLIVLTCVLSIRFNN